MSDDMLDPTRDQLEEYALGLLDARERAAFEAVLARDPALRAELAATEETLAALALSTPASTTDSLRARVMASIATAEAPRSTPVISLAAHRSRAPIWLTAALAAALMLVVKLAVDLRSAREDLVTSEATSVAGTRALAQRDSILAQLTDPSVQLVTMAAQGPAKPAMKAYLNTARRSVVIAAAGLESLPAGQAYQLWFIVDGKPVPSVTFRPDSAGKALVRDIPMPAGTVAATAITREPEAGSQAPTSAILFVGKPATE